MIFPPFVMFYESMHLSAMDGYPVINFFCRSVYGNVIVGPTFEESDTRRRPVTDAGTIWRLVRLGETCVPGLRGCPIVNTYTGVRPATQTKDYHIHSIPERSVFSSETTIIVRYIYIIS